MKGEFCTIRNGTYCQENSCSECAIYEQRNDDLALSVLESSEKTNSLLYHSLPCCQHFGSIPNRSIPAVCIHFPQDHAEAELFSEPHNPPPITPCLCNYFHHLSCGASIKSNGDAAGLTTSKIDSGVAILSPLPSYSIPQTAIALESCQKPKERASLYKVAGCGSNPQGNSIHKARESEPLATSYIMSLAQRQSAEPNRLPIMGLSMPCSERRFDSDGTYLRASSQPRRTYSYIFGGVMKLILEVNGITGIALVEKPIEYFLQNKNIRQSRNAYIISNNNFLEGV